MAIFKKIAGAIRWLLVRLSLPFVLLGLMLAFLTATAPGLMLSERLIGSVTAFYGKPVTISGIENLWSGNTKINFLRLSDGDGEPWLQITNAQLNWSPRELLRGRFEAAKVSAERVEVAHIPKSGSGGGSTSLPLAISIGEIELPDILLGPKISGKVSRLRVNGSVNADSGKPVSMALAASRIDGREGSLTGRVIFDVANQVLSADLKLAEPQDGVIANLLKLKGKPPLDISVQGSGPLENWVGRLDAKAGSQLVGLDVGIQGKSTGGVFLISGSGEFSSLVPEQVSFLFDGESKIDIAATLDNDLKGLTIEQAKIASQAALLSAVGSLSTTSTSDFSLTFTPAGDAVALTVGKADLKIGVVTLNVQGDAGAASINAQAKLAQVKTPDFVAETVDLDVALPSFNLANRDGSFTLSFAAASAGSSQLVVARALAGKLAGTIAGNIADGKTFTIDNASAASGTTSLTGNGLFDMANSAGTAKFETTIASTVFPPAVGALLDDQVNIASTLTRTADGAASFENFSFVSGGINASGAGQLAADGALKTKIDFALDNVAKVNPKISGEAKGTLNVTGTKSDPIIALDMQSGALGLSGVDLQNAKLIASGKTLSTAPQGQLEFAADVDGAPASVKVELAGDASQYMLNAIDLRLGDNVVTGNLVLSRSFVPQGSLALDLKDLAQLGKLAGQPIAGQASGTAVFSVAANVPSVAVNLSSSSLAASGAQAVGLRAQGTITDYLASPKFDGNVNASRASVGKSTLSDIALSASQEAGWTRFNGSLIAQGFPVSASGRLRSENGVVTVALDAAKTQYKGLPIALVSPTTLNVRGAKVQLQNAALNVAGGTLVLDGFVGPSLDVRATMRSVPLASLGAINPALGLQGVASGVAQISGAASNPVVRFTTDGSGISTAATRQAGISGLTVNASGNFASGKLTLNSSAQGAGGLTVQASGTVNTGSGNALALDINGQAPLSLLNTALRSSAMSVDGPARFSVRVTGSPSAPSVAGNASLQGGKFIDGKSGIAVTALGADIGFDGARASLRKVNGNLSTGGTVAGSGTVSLASGYPADIDLVVDGGRFSDGQIFTTDYSARLKISGNLNAGLTVGGQVNLAKTLINVPEATPSSLKKIDVKHRNESIKVAEQAQRLAEKNAAASAGGGLGLDVTISAPNRIFIRGRGLDVALGGTLQAKGTTRAPQATGGFEMLRGRMDFLGRRLDFSSGKVSFLGSIIPILDLVATSTVNSITINVALKGSASAPEITFSSSPTLPQDEILAQLIFGRSISKMSALQIASLASSVSTLGGYSKGVDLVGQLRSAAGVDDIDIKSDAATGETSVSIGKRLNNRTYLSVEKGASAGSGKARIDLNIGKGVKLRGEAGTSGDAKGGIFYEREY